MSEIDSLIKFIQPSEKSAGALYKQLAKSLIKAIDKGLLKAGDCLIAERELAERLEVSRVTVRKAIFELVSNGYLLQRQGAGTMVCEPPDIILHKSLSSVNGFTEDMQKRGLKPKSKLISRQQRQATKCEAKALNLKTDKLICRLSRIRLLDDSPLAYEIAIIPASIIPESMEINTSLYTTLAEQNMVPIRATQSIRAVNATKKVAHALDIKTGDAVLFMERQGFTKDNRIVEYTQSYYRGDRYDYTVELK